MALNTGFGGWFGIFAESTYGTSSTITHYYRMIATTLKRVTPKIERPVIPSGPLVAGHIEGFERVEGDIVLELAYEGLGPLLYHAMGATPTTSGPSGGLYTHTYKLQLALPTGLTFEVYRGATANVSEVFNGCKINQLKIEIKGNDVARVTLSIMGRSAAARTTASSPTYTSNDVPVIYHQGGTLSFNSTNYANVFKSLTFTIDNRLALRENCGSQYTLEPQRSGPALVTLVTELEYGDDTLHAAYHSNTQSDAAMTFTGTGSRTMAFTLHNAYLEDYEDSISNAGGITARASWKAESDGTDLGYQIVIVNTQSSALGA